MANNEFRNRLQKEACDELFRSGRVIVNWATGAGKSRVAVNAIDRLLDKNKTRILLLVTESVHKANWRKEFIDVLGDFLGASTFAGITVECYASLPKYAYSEWDLIIADEAHHLRSDNRCEILSTMSSEMVLCLSATINENGDADTLMESLTSTFGQFKTFDFSLQDAIDTGVLSPPRIIVHILKMEDMGVREFVFERGFKNARKSILINNDTLVERVLLNPMKYPHLSATVRLPMRKAYDAIDRLFAIAKNDYLSYCRYVDTMSEEGDVPSDCLKRKQFYLSAWLRVGLLRKNFLASCKTEYASQLLRSFGRRKYICFCNDVPQGIAIGGEDIVYSKRSAKENDAIITRFNNGETNSLFAVGMLKEGANLAGIELGLIIQLDGKERPFIQKFGRAMRSSSPEQHIIVFKGCQDRQYFKKAFENMNMDYVQYRFPQGSKFNP